MANQTWNKVKDTATKSKASSTPTKGSVLRKTLQEASKLPSKTYQPIPYKTYQPNPAQKSNMSRAALPPVTANRPPIGVSSSPLGGGSNYNPQATASPLKTGDANAWNPQQ